MVRKCTSFVIVCQAFEVRNDRGAFCLGNLTGEQMYARQVDLLPEEVRKSIAFLRIWYSESAERTRARRSRRARRPATAPPR